MATRDVLTLRTSKGSALSFNEMDTNFTTLADTIDLLTVSTVFNDLVITGNLTMNGVLTSANSSKMEIGDPVIVLNKNSSTPANDVGVILQRYSVASPTNYNIGFIWDESTDKLIIGKTSETATDADVTFDTNWLVIDSAGNVGVNQTTPIEKLDVAGNISLGNSTTATNMYVHNTYTNSTNYERAKIGWNAGVLEIGQEYAGTGVPRNINVKFGTNTLYLNNGASNVTPVMAISGASSKAAGFLVGTSGSSFIFDSSGPFSLAIDSKANIISGSSNGGTSRLSITTGGNIGINTTSPSARLDVVGDIEVNSNVNLNSAAATLATVTKTQIASFAAASFRSAKFIIQIYDSVTGEVQMSELLVVHNGTTASIVEYGIVYTGLDSLVVFDVDIVTGNVVLSATRTTANSTQYKVSQTLVVA